MAESSTTKITSLLNFDQDRVLKPPRMTSAERSVEDLNNPEPSTPPYQRSNADEDMELSQVKRTFSVQRS